MDCKCGCGQQIEEKPGGHRQRLFVDDAHKMRWHRQQQQNDQQEALLAELAELRTKVSDQAHTIELIMPVNSVQRQSYMEMLGELVELRTKVSDQAHTIELQQQEIGRLAHHYKLARQFQDDLEPHDQEIARLKKQLDFERRFLEDTKAYTFKSWLRKQPSSPWRMKFLSDQLVPPRTSRAGYQAHMKRVGCTDEEMEDFTRQWKLMLMQS